MNCRVPGSSACSVLGACLLLALFVNERYSGEPIVPYALWRVRSVVLTNLGAFCIGIVLSCTTFFLPAYVQGVLGYGARIAGLVYAAQALAWSVASVLAARIMARTNFRIAAACGGVLLIAGALSMAMSPTCIRYQWSDRGRDRHGALQHDLHRRMPGRSRLGEPRRCGFLEFVSAFRRNGDRRRHRRRGDQLCHRARSARRG